MRAIYVSSVIILVAAALLAAIRKGQPTPPEGAGDAPDATAGDKTIVLLIAAIVCAAGIARMFLDRYLVFDDAFMSYRYAKNLGDGFGLTWNPGEPPLEGYTNFLLVVLLAPFVKLGLDPLVVTRVFSFFAVLGLFAVAFVRARREARPTLAVAVSLTFLASMSAGFALAMVGLETVIFVGTLYLGFHLGSEYLRTGRDGLLRQAGIVLFAAFLLRPEALFMAGLLTAIGLRHALASRATRGFLAAIGYGFWLPFGLYLAWKYAYFGGVLPNPAYIKMSRAGFLVPSGTESLFGFFAAYHKILVLAVLAVFVAGREANGRLLAALFVGVYCAFYLRVDTLMDIHYRFLFPVAPFLFELATPIVRAAHEVWLQRRESALLKAAPVLVSFIFIAFIEPGSVVSDIRRAIRGEYNFPPEPDQALHLGSSRHIRAVAMKLGEYPGIEHLSIASVDAGVLAYYSRARHLDTVGLNDRFIARERDIGLLTKYFFGAKPTLIFQRDRVDGTLVTYGHGVLGDHERWADHPGWDDYVYVGSITDVEPWRHELHVYLRRDAVDGAQLRQFLGERIVDFVHAEPPIKLGSSRTAG